MLQKTRSWTTLCVLFLLVLSGPAVAGNVADDELAPLVQKIFDYLEGSVGLGIVIVAFVVAAIAAIAQRLVVFLSAFGLLIIVKYGPQVILNFFGATLDGLGGSMIAGGF